MLYNNVIILLTVVETLVVETLVVVVVVSMVPGSTVNVTSRRYKAGELLLVVAAEEDFLEDLL